MEKQFRLQPLEWVNTILPVDLAARIRAKTVLLDQKAINVPKMVLPDYEFNISYIEQGLVQRFVLKRDDLEKVSELPAIGRYALSCLGIADKQLFITISSTLGERNEVWFFQSHQLWTIMNLKETCSAENIDIQPKTINIFQ